MTSLPALAPAPTGDGVRFRVLSSAPERLFLQLYEDAGSPRPARTVTLTRGAHCREGLWETVVGGVGAGA